MKEKWSWSGLETSWKAIRSSRCVNLSGTRFLQHLKVERSNCKRSLLSFMQGWSKPGQGLLSLHYSANWFIWTDQASRWISVAPSSVTWSLAYRTSMCQASAVEVDVFILSDGRSLFNVPGAACLDWARPTSHRALCRLKAQHQRFSAQLQQGAKSSAAAGMWKYANHAILYIYMSLLSWRWLYFAPF